MNGNLVDCETSQLSFVAQFSSASDFPNVEQRQIEVALRGVEQFAKDVQRKEKDQRGEPRDKETRHGKTINTLFVKRLLTNCRL